MIPPRKPCSVADWSRFLLVHALVGAAMGVAVGAGILITNALGVGTLFWGTRAPLAAGALYFFSFASTFAACSIATAIMGLARKGR